MIGLIITMGLVFLAGHTLGYHMGKGNKWMCYIGYNEDEYNQATIGILLKK